MSWFVFVFDKKLGPYDTETLRIAIKNEQVNANNLAIKDNSSIKKRLINYPEFKDLFTKSAFDLPKTIVTEDKKEITIKQEYNANNIKKQLIDDLKTHKKSNFNINNIHNNIHNNKNKSVSNNVFFNVFIIIIFLVVIIMSIFFIHKILTTKKNDGYISVVLKNHKKNIKTFLSLKSKEKLIPIEESILTPIKELIPTPIKELIPTPIEKVIPIQTIILSPTPKIKLHQNILPIKENNPKHILFSKEENSKEKIRKQPKKDEEKKLLIKENKNEKAKPETNNKIKSFPIEWKSLLTFPSNISQKQGNLVALDYVSVYKNITNCSPCEIKASWNNYTLVLVSPNANNWKNIKNSKTIALKGTLVNCIDKQCRIIIQTLLER